MMKVSPVVYEVSIIIQRMESRLKREPTQQEILDEVLRIRGDRGCSITTIGKAKKYLKDSNVYGGLTEDLSSQIGKGVLRLVTELMPAKGGHVSLALEVNELRATLKDHSEKAKFIKSKLEYLLIDDPVLLDALDQIMEKGRCERE